jgi:hypothetical protein
MKTFISKYWKPLAAVFVLSMIVFGYLYGRDILRSWALNQAKAQMRVIIDKAEADKKAALVNRDALAEKAGRDMEEFRLQTEREKRKSDATFAVFKSETAAELRKRAATIAQVLVEKEKDELVIIADKETIDNLAQLNYLQGVAWRISEYNIAAENKKAMDALTLQYVTCQQWSNRLETSIRPTFWKRVKEYVKYGAAFTAGRLSAKVF